jgi:hypothetical protein
MRLDYFENIDNFYPALKTLFEDLNIPVNYIAEKPARPRDILTNFKETNPAFKLMEDVYSLGMVDDAAFEGNKSLDTSEIKSDYDGLLLFGVTLKERENGLLPTRSQLAGITRAFNREFHYTPVVVVFRYNQFIAFANTERQKYKQESREGEKAGKVSILRDVEIKSPHTGHLKILEELKITRSGKKGITSFEGLYQYWQEVFSVNLLNKKFYSELSNWYFWAIKHVKFPSESQYVDDKNQQYKAQSVIRLLTRLLFVWFIKEKKLIPEELFNLETLQKNILKKISPFNEKDTLFKEANKESIYYKAILQNLFFATLNCPVKPDSQDTRERGFRGDESYGKHRGIDYLMRYKKYFKDPDAFLEMVNKVVPFLNGGLFECLDDKDKKIYIDGFSDNMSKTNGKVNDLIVPDYLFFGREETTDLSADYGKKNKGTKEAAVKGLINILKSYKFTIAENTPIEEDVALDPELLGKVFENLLASYNPETKTTARKQTGSFYTPREIVNYMVDESLIAHLKNSVSNWNMDEKELDVKLHQLVSFEPVNPFEHSAKLKQDIIHSLDNCKILDPACGSGAFPMGILQKMVHILQKVDPNNEYWQELQLEKAEKATKGVFAIKDKEERRQLLDEINEAFDQSINNPDYARKLFLIENCIYGVDIQPIAAQISKLRFFISLVVEQKVNKEKDNFGIRPLPNLETKFVTANTLIGIDKPDGELFYTKEVQEKEAELKAIRHKLFSAKTKATKVKYRKKDEELRNKIADILKKGNLPVESAEQLASWDPYDQNGVSPFFDPEWMFDIKSGFDVVIGNPPYIDSEAMVKIFPSLRERLSHKYATAKGNWDIYIVFYEVAYLFLKSGGITTYITPNKWLSAPYGKKLREFLQRDIHLVADCSKINVFEAGNSPIIFSFIKNNRNPLIEIFEFCENWEILFRSNYSQEVLDVGNWGVLLSPFISIINLIKSNNTTLESKGYIAENPFATSEAYQLTDIVENNRELKDSFKLITTGGIDPYEILWGDKITSYLKSKYQYPRVSKNKLINLLPRRYNQQNCLKILISGMRHFEAYFDSNIECLSSKSTIIVKNVDIHSGFFLTSFLNSKLVKFYIKQSYSALGIDGGINFSKDMVNYLPFPKESYFFIYMETISKIIHILNAKGSLSKIFKDVNDAIVFELYFSDHMKERKIDILQFVEKDIEEVMQGKSFEALNDTQKEQVITELHNRWSNPHCEIVKRMNSFSQKSPEILKPILEGVVWGRP